MLAVSFCIIAPVLLFNSVEYWIFLPLVWLSYFALPQKYRWVWLLVCSYVFYGFWKVEFAALMAFTSILDWYCGLAIANTDRVFKRKFWLWLSILSNVGVLFMFKYFDFALGDSVLAKKMYENSLTAWIIELGKYTIPAGISFYTFQSISYVVDVYRGEETAQRNLPKFMLFVSFFPQLVAGPIERFGKLSSQLFQAYKPKWVDIQNGARIILWGLFLKVAVADNLATLVDEYYANPAEFSANSGRLAVFAFAFQVYADFFGYSLLAQGSALLFGIDLMDNFNKPYIAKSVPEFWHRWHISLSTWFRDYIFVPVGGNRKGPLILAFSAMLVFFTSGLWHGAKTTMIVFGVLTGLLYLFDRFVFGKIKIQHILWDYFRQFKTFFIFMLTLVYFRSASIPQSSQVWHGIMGDGTGSKMLNIPTHIPIFLLVFYVLDNWVMHSRVDKWIGGFSLPVRWCFYAFILLSVWMFGGAVNHPFVYFQF